MKPLNRKTSRPDYEVRPYRPGDREAIRRLCCDTGFLGEPIDAVFSDRRLFADYLTSYYTDWESELTWVGVVDGEIVGYLTGCKRWHLNRAWSLFFPLKLAALAVWRLLRGEYDAKDRRYLRWVLLRGWREMPVTPASSAHFHFNARKEHRRMNMMRDLLVTMLEDLRRSGVPRVHGQMATFGTKRSDRLFEYLGWKVVDKKRVTKYRDILERDIWLTTVLKDLREPESVNGPKVSLSQVNEDMPS